MSARAGKLPPIRGEEREKKRNSSENFASRTHGDEEFARRPRKAAPRSGWSPDFPGRIAGRVLRARKLVCPRKAQRWISRRPPPSSEFAPPAAGAIATTGARKFRGWVRAENLPLKEIVGWLRARGRRAKASGDLGARRREEIHQAHAVFRDSGRRREAAREWAAGGGSSHPWGGEQTIPWFGPLNVRIRTAYGRSGLGPRPGKFIPLAGTNGGASKVKRNARPGASWAVARLALLVVGGADLGGSAASWQDHGLGCFFDRNLRGHSDIRIRAVGGLADVDQREANTRAMKRHPGPS